MRVLINGALGRMGEKLRQTLLNKQAQVVGVDVCAPEGSDVYARLEDCTAQVDVVIDFSSHLATQAVTAYARKNNLPLVIATTGQTEEELACIAECARYVPVVKSGNFSLGVALLAHLAREAARILPDADIEIVETHHNQKADAPSGTALLIADAIRQERPQLVNHLGRSGYGKRAENEIGIHAVRLGSIVGRHEVYLGTPGQQITISHEAFDRSLFAEGAYAAAVFALQKEPGLYDMNDVVRG